MKRYLLALFVFTATIGVSAAWGQHKFQDSPLPEFQFYQRERLVSVTEGVVRLRRAPFLIHYAGTYEVPSIFASSDPQVLFQMQQVKSPIMSFTGTGLAALPYSLFVTSDPLEIFPDGWSPAFAAAYGRLFTAENVTLYQALRRGFPTEPTLLASGRNYTNFRRLADRSRMYTVIMLNERGVEQTPYKRLYLVLFAESTNERDPRKIQFSLLRYAPLTIEFDD